MDVSAFTLYYIGKKLIKLSDSVEYDNYSSAIAPISQQSAPLSVELDSLGSMPESDPGTPGHQNTPPGSILESDNTIVPMQPNKQQLEKNQMHPLCGIALASVACDALLIGMNIGAATCFSIDENGICRKSYFTNPQEQISKAYHVLCTINGLTTGIIMLIPYANALHKFLCTQRTR